MGTPKKDAVNHVQSKTNGETYGKVILTLKNCLLPEEKLSPTPSQIDGLDPDTEMDLRILGCELMQTAGILLKLPQVAMATAQVLFHRFYYSKSFVRQNYEITGMGCLYLASKIEEAPRRIRDVINVYHHIKQVNNQNMFSDNRIEMPTDLLEVSKTDIGIIIFLSSIWAAYGLFGLLVFNQAVCFILKKNIFQDENRPIAPMVLDQSYINLKYQVIKAERRVLKELGFCVHVKHPHKLIVLYLQVLGLEAKQTLMQLAWNYMNDSLRTDVFVRYQPETIACACIYLTSRRLKIIMPKAWFVVFKVEEKDIMDVCVRILRLYVRPKPNVENLERKVQELSKKFEENRIKNKTGFSSNVASGTNTPTSPSVTEKKTSPKRRSHSDRSRSRSRSASASPKHKKSKKHKRSTSRSRSRSRSYEKKYKKSHKNNRRSRSSSPNSKTYKDKKYRSRSRSYDRDYKKLPNDGKYYSDRYKEEKGYDRYYKERMKEKEEEKYRKDDDKYRKEKSSSKEDERHKKDDKHKKNDENYRKDDKYRDDNYKNNSEKNYDDDYKDDRKLKYKNDDKYSRDNKYATDKNSKNDKYDDKDRYSSDKYSSREKHKSVKSDKYNSKDDDYISKDDSYSSKREKYENDRKRKSKHKSDDEDDDEEDEDDVEVLSVKREKKSR